MQDFCPGSLREQHAQLRSQNLASGVIESGEGVETTIETLRSHSLATQNEVALLNRVDSKYLLPLEQLAEILNVAAKEYSVLQIDQHRLFTYQNTYFDLPSLRYFRHHHSGKLNRHKVRYRRYAETDDEFFEIKFKTNKKRTIKHRELLDSLETAAQNSLVFAESHIAASEVDRLRPVLHVNYRRLSLVDTAGTERVTIDLDLRFQRLGSPEFVHIPDLVIAELKQERQGKKSAFQKLLQTAGANKTNFSKYCVGCCLTGDKSLKQNRFRPLLRRLQDFPQRTISTDKQFL